MDGGCSRSIFRSASTTRKPACRIALRFGGTRVGGADIRDVRVGEFPEHLAGGRIDVEEGAAGARGESIIFRRLDIGNLFQDRFKLLSVAAGAALGEVVFRKQSSQLLGDGGRDQLIDGRAFLAGALAKLLV